VSVRHPTGAPGSAESPSTECMVPAWHPARPLTAKEDKCLAGGKHVAHWPKQSTSLSSGLWTDS
jgi:hypothetical protein